MLSTSAKIFELELEDFFGGYKPAYPFQDIRYFYLPKRILSNGANPDKSSHNF